MAANAPSAVVESFVAGADLSGQRYRFVKLNASGQAVPVTAITDIPIGVLQNDPIANQTATVVISGGTKVRASAAIVLPAVLGVDATGNAKKVVPGTDITQYVVGQADVAAAATGDIVSAVVNLSSPSRAA